MTYPELQIQLDLNPDNRVSVLENVDTCQITRHGFISYSYLFVDSKDGQCYLFDEDGHKDDISKVKEIGAWTFEHYESLISIKIPNSVESIGGRAFYYCISLTSIKIPSSVKSIGSYAFDNCTSLTSISISDSVKNIGNYAFVNCTSLKEVVFKGKTIDQVKAMENYPWGIEDESVIKCK